MEDIRLSTRVLFLLLYLGGVQTQPCTFPDALRGQTLISSTLGEVTFTDSTVTLKEGLVNCVDVTPGLIQCPLKNFTLTCTESAIDTNTANYLLSGVFPQYGTSSTMWICWYISPVSDNKWVYYQGPKKYQTFYKSYVVADPVASFTMNEVCDLSTPLPVDRYNLLLSTDNLASQPSPCPDAMLATFTATPSDNSSCATELNVCATDARSTFSTNDTSCQPNEYFTAAGDSYCLHSLEQDDVTYVMMYTRDVNVTFSCLAFIQNEVNDLYISLYVKQQNQSCLDLTPPSNTTFQTFLNSTDLCPFPCTFPTELSGAWESSHKGSVSFMGTNVTGLYPETLECYKNDQSRYLLRTEVTPVDGIGVRVYMCLGVTKLTPSKYLYYQLHNDNDTTLNDYVQHYNPGRSVTLAQACDDLSASPYIGSRHHLLLKPDAIASAYTACPDALTGVFNNTDGNCSSTMQVGCVNSSALQVTGTDCTPRPFYTVQGKVNCLYSRAVSGNTYLTLHNSDASGSVDGVDTYKYTCAVFKLSGQTLSLSQNPLECLDDQTATSFPSGPSFTYDRTGTCPTEAEDTIDLLLIIIIVCVILLVIIIVAIIIICCVRRKRRLKRRQEEDEEAAILKDEKEQEDTKLESSALSLDSGYGYSPGSQPHVQGGGGGTPGGGGGRGGSSHGGVGGGVGSPRVILRQTYGVAEDQDPKQVNVQSRLRHQRQRRDGGRVRAKGNVVGAEISPDVEQEMTYSDDSWEEYLDGDGNTYTQPKEGTRRQRRKRKRRRRQRKKEKHTSTKTRVLEDGTTVEEEVESEYSVSASSDDVTSSSEEGEDMGEKIREAKEKRSTRLQKIMGRVPASDQTDGGRHSQMIVTREMDEKKRQPERKKANNSLLGRLRRKARDRKSNKKVAAEKKKGDGGLFEGDAGAVAGAVAGLEKEGKATPYLLQYQAKKDIEGRLRDKGYFDDNNEKATAESIYGFGRAERELSPKPGDLHQAALATATDSSATGQDSRKLEDFEESDDVNDDGVRGAHDVRSDEDGREETSVSGTSPSQASPSLIGSSKKDKTRHVVIASPSPTPSSAFSDSSDMSEDLGGKVSDTSSGVADLSQSSPEQHAASGTGAGRRVSGVGWEKVQTVHARRGLHRGGDGEDRGGASRQSHRPSKKGKVVKDKRVKTALRRLLNERLFASTGKKKRRDDDTDDTCTNADSVGNNVSDASSPVGSRAPTRHSLRPLVNGRVAAATAEDEPKGSSIKKVTSRGLSVGVRIAITPQGIHDLPRLEDDEENQEDNDNEGGREERIRSRPGTMLPPLRSARLPIDSVFTPANFPKWGLCVTASQRGQLVAGLERDKTFLSRSQAQSAWGSRGSDGHSMSARSRANGEDLASDDPGCLDPHIPEGATGGERPGTRGQWATRREVRNGQGAPLSFTGASGRSPLDMDDRRLRRLLEELYKDKKYMDSLINKLDEDHLELPDHIAADDVKFLSEFGRSYLLRRAEYWDLKGPLGPPRPMPTALGMRLSRANTTMASHDLSHDSSSQEVTSPRPKTVR